MTAKWLIEAKKRKANSNKVVAVNELCFPESHAHKIFERTC